VPRVFVKDRRVHEEPPELVVIEDGAKYFINAGSVGQPRDGDWRASYVIYDMSENKVVFRRIEYDLATAQKKILATDLPPGLADRLAEGR
jgi:diadenosine tetraphosphatase ApaH/serine/threonine PP2A family protein phosphatase